MDNEADAEKSSWIELDDITPYWETPLLGRGSILRTLDWVAGAKDCVWILHTFK
jgi:hypothetical protein